jgi:arginase family enzyme
MREPRTGPVRGSAREQSCYVGLYDQCWPNDYAFKDRFRLIDYGDVASFPGRTEDMIAAVEESVSKLVDGNVASLGLGGDHLTSYPALKAHAKKHGPLALIHFDAHADLTQAPHLFHGSMFGVAVQKRLIDPDASIQIGIRTPLPPSPKLHVLTAVCAWMAKQSRRRSRKWSAVGSAMSPSISTPWTPHIPAAPELPPPVDSHRPCSEKFCGI